MQVNRLLFPNPKISYQPGDLHPNLLYLPRPPEITQKPPYIPCLFLPAIPPSPRILIMFHGNGEDLGMCINLCKAIKKYLKISIVAVEYPGYGIYKGRASSQKLLQDAYIVYNYITKSGWAAENIMLLGRSIGSGPATWLAMKHKVGGLVLISPYTSIKSAAKYLLGSFFSFFIADRFHNIKYIAKCQCPALIIHGRGDMMLPYTMSEMLFDKLNPEVKSLSRLFISESMEHNSYNMKEDVIKPLKLFKWAIFEKYIDILNCQLPTFTPDLFATPLDINYTSKRGKLKGGDIELTDYPKFWNQVGEWNSILTHHKGQYSDCEAKNIDSDTQTLEEEKVNDENSTDVTNQ